MSWYPSFKSISGSRASIVSVIDIGSSKVACAIFKLKPMNERGVHPLMSHSAELLGLGVHRSDGVKAGHIANVKAARHSIQSAIAHAENKAKVTVQRALVITTCGRLSSEAFSAHHDLSKYQIASSDIDALVHAGRRFSVEDNRLALHAHALGYRIDGSQEVDNPLGMVGESLELNMHLATVDTSATRNLIFAAEASHIQVQSLVAAPFASGLACLSAEDHDHGSLVVDCGADTTSFAVFSNGRMQHLSSVAIGGRNITKDLSRVFSLSLQDAERLKVLHGSAYYSPHHPDELVTSEIGEDTELQERAVYRSELNQVIEARVLEIFECVRDQLNAAGFPPGMPTSTVLTGGASQLNGLPDVAERVLQSTVRVGEIKGFGSASPQVNAGALSAIFGTVIYAQQAEEDFVLSQLPLPEEEKMLANEQYFARVGRWLRDSF